MTEPPLDQVGPWTEIKIEIIERYAREYSTILTKQPFIRKHVYLDAFAGWGQHYSKSKGKIIRGTPRVALEIEPPFSEYHFIDIESSKIDELDNLKNERPGRVYTYHGDCNSILMHDVLPHISYAEYHRALCLLDPYSMQLNWGGDKRMWAEKVCRNISKFPDS